MLYIDLYDLSLIFYCKDKIFEGGLQRLVLKT